MGLAHPIAGYSHVNILVDDLQAAHDFYIGTLGFSVLPRPDFGGFGDPKCFVFSLERKEG